MTNDFVRDYDRHYFHVPTRQQFTFQAMSRKMRDRREFGLIPTLFDVAEAARARLDDLAADATDAVLADAGADYLIARTEEMAKQYNDMTYRFQVLHDTRKNHAPNKLLLKHHYQCTLAEWERRYGIHCGQPLLHFDWSRKNNIGIKTKDRAFAHRWCSDAFFFGYAVFMTIGSGGAGQGSLSDIRRRDRDRRRGA